MTVRATGKIVKAHGYEETGTDVNLAVDLVADAPGGSVDRALVIYNDSNPQRAVDRTTQSGVDVFVAVDVVGVTGFEPAISCSQI